MKTSLVQAIAMLAITGTVCADGALEVLISTQDASVPGVPGAVWVPNQFNNPTIDGLGNVAFRGQIGGDGITTANRYVFIRGNVGAWNLVARDGSPVPTGIPEGYVFNTTSGINGISSANNRSANGGSIVAGNINGAGNSTATDTAAYWVAADGSAAFLARESDPCPGTAGAIMSGSFSLSSGIQVTNEGECIISTAVAGGDTGTANNAALVKLSPANGPSLVFRKGSPAPGFADGTTLTPDTFTLNINGAGDVEFGGTLVGGSVTTANDKARFTSVGAPAGSLRMWIREGDPIPGFNSLFVKATTTVAMPNHPLQQNGGVIFTTDLTGDDVVAGVTDHAAFIEQNGTFTKLMQRGDAVEGVTDGTFKSVNFAGWVMNSNGLLVFQGILQNPDGTNMAANSAFIGYRRADGSLVSILRQGQPLPGDGSVLVGALNGSSNICVSDTGVAVFSVSLGTAGTVIMAWDESNGIRTVFRTGDTTTVPGATLNSVTLIGSSGVNGDGGNSGISPTGTLVFKARDTVASIDVLLRVDLDAGSACPADLDGNGAIDGGDLALLLGNWGAAGSADLDGSGAVDGADLASLLSSWGSCD